jgi:DNA modification methylase
MNSFLNNIIQWDCIELLKKLPDNSVDLIFADPPYNLQLQWDLTRPNDTIVDWVNDDWDKFDSFSEYDKFCELWLNECKRILKDTWSIWVIWSYHNIFRVGKIMQDLWFRILNDIIRVKTNPMPNFKWTRFNNAHETLIRASKWQWCRYTFHYKWMKAFNDDKQMRSDWNISICLWNERLKDEKWVKVHSTQKPEELLYRIILSSSNMWDTVLDPFMWSWTTWAVSKLLKRNFIWFERESKYIKAANERIKKVEPIDENILIYKIETPRPKVSFWSLISRWLIIPWDYLYNKDWAIKAKILSDWTLEYNWEVWSIHKISAYILNKSTNNWWDFWYKKDWNNYILIDKLRDAYFDMN